MKKVVEDHKGVVKSFKHLARAISSAGQSAPLIRVRSLVQIQHSPLVSQSNIMRIRLIACSVKAL